MSFIAQMFEDLADSAWVVPSGTGYLVVNRPASWRAGWYVWLQGPSASVVLAVTAIDQATRRLSVTRVALATNPAAATTIAGPLTLTPIPFPVFDEPGAVPVTFLPYQINRIPFTVPTGANVDYLWYPKSDYMNPVWTRAGVRLFVQGIGTFEIASTGLVEDVATIDAVPYTACYKIPVKVVRLLPSIVAGTTLVPDGAAFFCATNQLDTVEDEAVHGNAFWDYALHNAGPHAPGSGIPITSTNETTDAGGVYGILTSGKWQAKKAGVYLLETFLVFNLAGYTPADIVAPLASIMVGGVPAGFGPMMSVVNSDRMALTCTTFATLAVDDLVEPTWYDQPGSGVPQNLETTGGSAAILSYLKVTFIREA